MFALSDALAGGGIKENVWVIGGILSLYKTIQFRVIWCLLTKDGVAKDWRVRGEVLKQTERVSVLRNTGSGQTGGVFFSAWRYS